MKRSTKKKIRDLWEPQLPKGELLALQSAVELASSSSLGGNTSHRMKRKLQPTGENPKILLLGMPGSGKSALVRRIKEPLRAEASASSSSTLEPTIGFNSDRVEAVPGYEFHLWEIGGQEKLRGLWYHYYDHTDLLVFCVPSDAEDESLCESGLLLTEFVLSNEKLRGIPLLIAFTKGDAFGARDSMELLQGLLKLSGGIERLQESRAVRVVQTKDEQGNKMFRNAIFSFLYGPKEYRRKLGEEDPWSINYAVGGHGEIYSSSSSPPHATAAAVQGVFDEEDIRLQAAIASRELANERAALRRAAIETMLINYTDGVYQNMLKCVQDQLDRLREESNNRGGGRKNLSSDLLFYPDLLTSDEYVRDGFNSTAGGIPKMETLSFSPTAVRIRHDNNSGNTTEEEQRQLPAEVIRLIVSYVPPMNYLPSDVWFLTRGRSGGGLSMINKTFLHACLEEMCHLQIDSLIVLQFQEKMEGVDDDGGSYNNDQDENTASFESAAVIQQALLETSRHPYHGHFGSNSVFTRKFLRSLFTMNLPSAFLPLQLSAISFHLLLWSMFGPQKLNKRSKGDYQKQTDEDQGAADGDRDGRRSRDNAADDGSDDGNVQQQLSDILRIDLAELFHRRDDSFLSLCLTAAFAMEMCASRSLWVTQNFFHDHGFKHIRTLTTQSPHDMSRHEPLKRTPADPHSGGGSPYLQFSLQAAIWSANNFQDLFTYDLWISGEPEELLFRWTADGIDRENDDDLEDGGRRRVQCAARLNPLVPTVISLFNSSLPKGGGVKEQLGGAGGQLLQLFTTVPTRKTKGGEHVLTPPNPESTFHEFSLRSLESGDHLEDSRRDGAPPLIIWDRNVHPFHSCSLSAADVGLSLRRHRSRNNYRQKEETTNNCLDRSSSSSLITELWGTFLDKALERVFVVEILEETGVVGTVGWQNVHYFGRNPHTDISTTTTTHYHSPAQFPMHFIRQICRRFLAQQQTMTSEATSVVVESGRREEQVVRGGPAVIGLLLHPSSTGWGSVLHQLQEEEREGEEPSKRRNQEKKGGCALDTAIKAERSTPSPAPSSALSSPSSSTCPSEWWRSDYQPSTLQLFAAVGVDLQALSDPHITAGLVKRWSSDGVDIMTNSKLFAEHWENTPISTLVLQNPLRFTPHDYCEIRPSHRHDDSHNGHTAAGSNKFTLLTIDNSSMELDEEIVYRSVGGDGTGGGYQLVTQNEEEEELEKKNLDGFFDEV